MIKPIISTKEHPIKKIGLYADPHLSQSSSIIVGRQGEFTGRLENLIKSFEWMNNKFKEENVDIIVCLGDLTDRPDLTALEITALSKCNVDEHYLIIGNHCRSDKDGNINSLSIYERTLSESQPLVVDEDGNTLVHVLPYNSDIIDLTTLNHPKVILSHNDLKGYDFGNFIISQNGYKITDILENCKLFINGHLHSGGWVFNDRILNLGVLSGINFSGCSGKWNPSIGILDLDTLKVDIIENPEAYKFKYTDCDTLPKLKKYLDSLKGSHYVLQIKVPKELADNARKLLSQSEKVEASRLLFITETSDNNENKEKPTLDTNINTYQRLRDFIDLQNKSKFDKKIVSDIINELERTEGVE